MRTRAQLAIAFCIALALCLCPVIMCAAPLQSHHCCPAKAPASGAHASQDCHLCQFVNTRQAPLDDAPVLASMSQLPVESLTDILLRTAPAPRLDAPPPCSRLIPLRI